MKLSATLLLGSLLVAPACGKNSEPPPTEHATPTPTDAAALSVDTGLPPPARSPDWTFDPEDPAKDYVGRYLRATLRYGVETACIVLGRSTFKDGESVVEVRNPADGSCGKPGELRDTFIASVTQDRLRIDDAAHRPALKPWPDGSKPDAAPGMVVSIADLHQWKAPLHEVIKKQQLWPTRVQLYGRGTYPVVTIAGWHALFDPKGDLAALQPAAQELCAANKGAPMAFFAGLSRTLILRIDCPDKPHWEDLGL